ncbi:hypothetical protein ABFS83_08G233300 [Erythranthe nasuta]
MKMQIAFYVLVFLFISAIDESTAGPQMCNEFKGCTVTINVCKTKCKPRGGIFGFCANPGATVDLSSPPASPTIDDVKLMYPAKQKPSGKCACYCKYKTNKKKCPVEKTPPVC